MLFKKSFLVATAILACVLLNQATAQDTPPLIRLGIIGLDTSHAPAFTKLLNGDGNQGTPLENIRVVAAFPGGSPDIPSSINRVEGFTKTVRDAHGVEIVDSIADLLTKVDAVLLTSVDGRTHRAQATEVINAGKPLFIDKPLAGSLVDAIAIYDLAKEKNVPCFSSSSLRFSPGILDAPKNPELGKVVGCVIYSPCSLEATHPDLFWYGVHGIEMLYTVMGTGCESLVRVKTDGTDVVTGTWEGGRVATYRGIREGKADYGGVIFGEKSIQPLGKYSGYQPLVVEIAKFLRSGQPPIPADETIEMFAFMEAADESVRQDGAPVTIQSVIDKARAALNAENQQAQLPACCSSVAPSRLGTILSLSK